MSEYLFTYGTLRLDQSHPMAHFLAENASLVGLGILTKARLYRIDWYPALIETNDEQDEVIGDEYRRAKVIIKTEKEELESWVYFYNIPLPENAELIESGDFLNP